MNAGLIPENLSPLDRLCFVGCNDMGAISYEPEKPNSTINLPTDLDEINLEIQAILYLTREVKQCEVQKNFRF